MILDKLDKKAGRKLKDQNVNFQELTKFGAKAHNVDNRIKMVIYEHVL